MIEHNFLEEIQEYICNGRQPIFRLGAIFDNFNGQKLMNLSSADKESVIKSLIRELMEVKLPPNNIFLGDNDIVSAHWYPPYPLCFNNVGDFLNLVYNFEEYLNTFKFSQGKVDWGMLGDDPAPITLSEDTFNKIFGVYSKGVINSSIKLDLSKIQQVYKTTEVYDFRR
jgi:hypothetical protein